MKDVDQRTDAVISCFALVAALGFYVASQYVGAAILTILFLAFGWRHLKGKEGPKD